MIIIVLRGSMKQICMEELREDITSHGLEIHMQHGKVNAEVVTAGLKLITYYIRKG